MQTPSENSPTTYRRKTRNTWILIGSIAAIGFLTGYFGGVGMVGGITPSLTLGLGAGVLLLAALCFFAHARTDEHEQHLDRVAVAIGGALVITVYPAWLVLSLGEWVAPPSALGLWGLAVMAMLGVFAVLRYRHMRA
ncbi:hypothetical protein [Salinisphaera sp. Q1T1-3]|uniref:hypothetical protein n=1 Tax=Salinisphaera sp. Q1T1-3 TaxID=2321229 RepID=UPI000E73FA24|nr:hypothetical protein [Salinisphaera sp. Q1T1-3]RJS92511.1 hypothetical protein D3260_11310 [Salinisphaera sp. Q1T1-3]